MKKYPFSDPRRYPMVHHHTPLEFDGLTDLPNLLYFRQYARQYVQNARLMGRKVYLIFFNLENFSGFNARYGFEEGDRLLTLTALALQQAFPGWLLSRISEDHFILICESLHPGHAVELAREELHAYGRRANVELKAGIYVYDDDTVHIGQAIDWARVACESISHRYDHCWRHYDDALAWYEERRHYIENHIIRAIDEGWIQVYYQPIIRTITGKLCEFEALARWDDPRYGLLSPAVFIDVLERARLIHLLDECVIRQVCEQWRSLADDNPWRVPVSVNLSRYDFELCDAPEMVNNIACEYDIPHQMLHIEVTESAINDNKDLLGREIERFRAANYQVWLDDFGSGYSSLNTLKDYQFDVVKIDMAFLREFDTKPSSRVIIASIVNMAKQLGMQTLIEGVETESQFDFLHEIGCEFCQGYLIGKPVRAEDNVRRLLAGELVAEKFELHGYHSRLGAINQLSANPFDFPWEQGAAERPLAEMLPLAIVEMTGDVCAVLTRNEAFIRELMSLGMHDAGELVQVMNKSDSKNARLIRQTLKKASISSGIESVDMMVKSRHYVLRCRHVSSCGDTSALLVSLINLSRFSDVNEQRLEQVAFKYMYLLYDIVNIIDTTDASLTTLYRGNATFPASDEGLDAKGNIAKFANTYVHPADRGRFQDFCDFDKVFRRVSNSNKNHLIDSFRMKHVQGLYQNFACELVPIDFEDHPYVVQLVRPASQEIIDTIGGEQGIPKTILWDTLLELVPAGVFWKDRDRRFVGVNKNFLDFYDFSSEDDVIGKTDEDMGWHVDVVPFMENELTVIEQGKPVINALGTCISQGEVRHIRASKIPLRKEGDVIGLLGYFTEQASNSFGDSPHLENGFDRMSRTDDLTGVVNLHGLLTSVSVYADSYQMRGCDFCFISIVVQGMKKINDLLGRNFGNHVLVAVAKRLEKAVGVQGVVARVGGDNFGVLFQTDSLEEAAAKVKGIAQTLDTAMEIDGLEVDIRLEMGWALFSEDHDMGATMLRATDRRLGRQTYPESIRFND